MKKTIVTTTFILIAGISLTAYADEQRDSLYKDFPFMDVGGSGCLHNIIARMEGSGIPVDEDCTEKGLDEKDRIIGQRTEEFSGSDAIVVKKHNGEATISLDDRYAATFISNFRTYERQVIPHPHYVAKLTPASELSDEEGLLLNVGYYVVVLDKDDPRYREWGHLGKLIALPGLIWARTHPIDVILGEHTHNTFKHTEYYGYNEERYQADKAKLIAQAKKDSLDVKFFGTPIYNASRADIAKAMKAAGLKRIGSENGYVSDVYDSSAKVSGSTQLTFRYDASGHVVEAEYNFDKNAKDIKSRLETVYGRIDYDQPAEWTRGYIDISVSSDVHNNESIIYKVRGGKAQGIAEDHSADKNAF